MIESIGPTVATNTIPDGSATYRTYLALRRMIVIGELKPGEKLKIDRLRTILQTGASPIREALSLLTSDHIVERIDQRGSRAAPTSQKNFEEILALRCELEDMALRQSIENRTQEWEEETVLCHHRMERAEDRGEDFDDLHKAFHMSLLSNCEAPILLKFCSQLNDLNVRYRFLAGNSLNYNLRETTKEHKDILNAAISGDADKASNLLLGHYRRTGKYLFGLLGKSDLT